MNKKIQGDFQICISVPITDFLYSEHLFTTNTFLRNAWNDCPKLIAKPLYSAHFITDLSMADIIFKSKITLLPRTDLSIADTLNNRLCNTFIVRNVRIFYFIIYILLFYNVLQFSMSFLWSLLFYFLASLIPSFKSIKTKICGDFQSVSTSMVDSVTSWKMYKAQ